MKYHLRIYTGDTLTFEGWFPNKHEAQVEAERKFATGPRKLPGVTYLLTRA